MSTCLDGLTSCDAESLTGCMWRKERIDMTPGDISYVAENTGRGDSLVVRFFPRQVRVPIGNSCKSRGQPGALLGPVHSQVFNDSGVIASWMIGPSTYGGHMVARSKLIRVHDVFETLKMYSRGLLILHVLPSRSFRQCLASPIPMHSPRIDPFLAHFTNGLLIPIGFREGCRSGLLHFQYTSDRSEEPDRTDSTTER